MLIKIIYTINVYETCIIDSENVTNYNNIVMLVNEKFYWIIVVEENSSNNDL